MTEPGTEKPVNNPIQPGNDQPNGPASDKPWGMDLKAFCMLMHLSQLAGYILPGAGFALPIVMWATNKDQFPEVDQHGKVILNWLISFIIYCAICAILTMVIIGIFGFMLLGLLSLIFVIIGAVKANDGEVWEYPLSIKFFK